MDFTGLKIFDIYGVSKIPIQGVLSASDLSDLMVENWIPYMECHKCGKSDYCKFAIPHPYNNFKKKERKCGVAEAAIRNFIDKNFHILLKLEKSFAQKFLDGAFYFTSFVLETEVSIGNIIDTELLDWYGDSAPAFFGRITHIRDILNSFSSEISDISQFNSRRALILVEGWAEKAFLDKLKESHSAWFLDKIVECYDGKGNRRSKRIAMLLDKYHKLGYELYLQGDLDGQTGDIFKSIVESKLVENENTFTFKHDFETAIPIPLLVRGLRKLGAEITFKPRELASLHLDRNQSINKTLLELGFDISKYKTNLALAVADILNRTDEPWWVNEKFIASELGMFLKFVQGTV